jgi:large subunit ribosomal protein L24
LKKEGMIDYSNVKLVEAAAKTEKKKTAKKASKSKTA